MSTVQDNLTNQVLDRFHTSIGVNLMKKTDDWQSRQKIQYESMKGLMVVDWLSLADWGQQINLYSQTNIILRSALGVITALISRNQQIRATLTNIQGLGLVGKFLLGITGFKTIFVAPSDLLSDTESTNTVIQALN